MSIQELLEYDLGKLKTITVDEIIIVNDPIQPRNGITLAYFNANVPSGGSATLSNGGAGQSLVSSTSLPPALATKSLTAGSGITLTPTGTDITISASGTAGPYLPLAGGTMDPLPVGIITAHTIDGIGSLTGGSVAPFIIQTDSGGANILIDSTPSSGNVDINAFSTTITTDPTATTGIEMNGSVVITPPTGYTYPESIIGQLVNVGAQIKNWYNTNVAGTTNQAGLTINVIKADTGQCFGIVMDDINAISADAYAIICSTVNGANSAYGASFANITSAGNATAFSATSVTGIGSAVGLSIATITSTTGNSSGIQVGSIQGETDCQGLEMTSITSNNGNGHGVRMDTINSTNGNAFGIRMNAIQSAVESYGFFITSIGSTADKCWGGKIDTVRSDTTDSVGLEIKRVGDAVTSGKSATGLYIVETLGGAGGTDEAKGIFIDQVTSEGTATGILVSAIQSSTSDVYGIKVEGLSTPLGTSYGCYLTTNNTSAVQFGFYQNGTLNQGNVLEAQTTIGAQSGANTALVVNGCMKTSVQRTAVTPFTIDKNTGNTVISTVVGASSIVLPAVTSIEDGLTFSIFHRGTGAITISGSGGQTINGGATFNFPGVSGYTYMTVWWDFVANDWFAHVN